VRPGDRDRLTDPDATGVLPAYPGGVDDTHPLPRYQPEPPRYTGIPSHDQAPFDATVEQPRVRDYPGGYDDTQPLPRFSDAATAPVPVPQAPPPTPVEVPAEESETGGRSVARHGAGMAIGSVVSRLTGFVRTAAIGAAIGGLAVANDYNIANTLPGMV
jgi:putative peptidoglycan lipid II flippase